MKTEDVLPRLKKVKRNKNGWMALCPAHDDRTPSLSISDKDGHALLNCFAGCTYDDVVSALGIGRPDLPKFGRHQKGQGKQYSNYQVPTGEPFESDADWVRKATYDYDDVDGKLLYQILRYEKRIGSQCVVKKFQVRRKDASGAWQYELGDVKRVPYHLPELANATEVFIVEGEKDVDALRERGIVATCNPFGAGKWQADYSQSLKDKRVVVWPDNDAAGERHARDVANSLIDIASEVRIAKIPRVSDKGDISDFLRSGGSIDELREVADRADVLTLEKQKQTNCGKGTLIFTTLPDLLDEPEEKHSFVWEDTLPTGGFSICSAKPKVGKSTFARNLVAAISTGTPFLGRRTVQGKVICLFLEEKRAEIRAHFERMGAKSSNILVHTGPAPDSISELEAAIIENDAAFVVIDPLCRLLRVSDLNEYAGVAKAIEPFVDISRRTGAHIMSLHHESKADRGDGDGLLGSTAILGSLDSNLRLRRDGIARLLTSIQRYGRDIEGMQIVLDRETGIVTTDGDARDMSAARVRERIVAELAREQPLTSSQIKARVSGFNNGVITAALKNAVEVGSIQKTGSGKKNSPFVYSKVDPHCATEVAG